MDLVKGKARIITVTSGKGGVGKTNVVTNIAYAMAITSKNILIIDADLGLGNIDVLLGITPKYNIEHILNGQKKIKDILVKYMDNMYVLPSASGVQELSLLSNEQLLYLSQEFSWLSMKFDIILLDTGAGISSNVTYFCKTAGEILIIVTPEPTSITDAYALMKVLYLKHAQKDFNLLVNGVKSEREAKDVFRQLSIVIDKYLVSVSLSYRGYILLDENLPKAVRQQKAVMELFPRSKSSICFINVAKDIIENVHETETQNQEGFWRQLLTIKT